MDLHSFQQRILASTIMYLAVFPAGSAIALTPIDRADLSPDITQTLDSQTIHDEDVAADDLMSGTITPASLGALPAESDVNAYHLLTNGDQLLSFDITIELAGPLTATPGDVVRYDGASYSLEFDASAESVPDGVRTDAVSLDVSSGDLVFSFDTTVSLSGSAFDDEDLVLFDGVTFTSYFDGSAQGVDAALDLDGAHVFQNGNLALSFNSSGSVAGVSFDDEDVLEFDPVGLTWEMAWDASVQRPEWSAGTDVNAVHFVPEPGRFAMLVAGGGFLASLHSRRKRDDSRPRDLCARASRLR